MKSAVAEQEEAPTTKKKKVAEIRRFRLKKGVGPHWEPNPDFDKTEPESEDNQREFLFEPGEVVKSTRNLAKIFEGKFVKYDRMQEEEEAADADEKNEKARELNLKLAKEAEEDAADDPIEAERRATRTSRHTPEQKSKRLSQLEQALTMDDDDEEEEGDEPKSKKKMDMGEEVTEDFEAADEAGMKVFKSGTKYFVTEADDTDKLVTSRKGIKRVDVSKFLKKQLKK